MDQVQQALNILLGRNKPLSPIPQNQVLDTPDKLQMARQNVALQGLQQLNPKAPIDKNSVGNFFKQWGYIPQSITDAVKQYGQAVNPVQGGEQVMSAQTKQDQPSFDPTQEVPGGTDLAMNFLKQKAGGKDPIKYYKALQDPDFMNQIQTLDKQKPGMGNLLLMQGFYESTLGNSGNGNNVFGALPGGEESGQQAQFNSPSEALQYQVGKNVLGGGGNPNMNVMSDNKPLTLGRIQQLYQSYNPEGAYIQPLIQTLSGKPTN
jgi:hypothetical protein